MSTFNTNIEPTDVINQLEKEGQKKTFTTFDPKNYLNTRLEGDETSKTLTIRLLPPSPQGGFPFEKVYMHQIKVNKEVSKSGWKTLPCPTHNHLGESCPFCDVSDEAKKARFETVNEQEKNKYKEIETLNRVKEMWVVRCIERGHEEDGVKFWLLSNAKDGPYAKIMNVWSNRWKKAQERGTINNIFDLNNGKDLDVTITRSADGKNVISVVDSDEKTPLTDDFEKGNRWINDPKKWSDVYKVKPYDYMEILVNGGIPVFSQKKNKYVDRDTEMAEKKEEEAKQLASNLTTQGIDYSKMPTEEEVTNGGIFMNAQHQQEEVDDLPY